MFPVADKMQGKNLMSVTIKISTTKVERMNKIVKISTLKLLYMCEFAYSQENKVTCSKQGFHQFVLGN